MHQPLRERRPLASVILTVALLTGVIGVVMVGGATASPALAMAATGHWVYNATSQSAQHIDGGTTAVDAQVAVPLDDPVYMTLQGDQGGFVVTEKDVTALTKSDLTVAGSLGVSSPERPFGIETSGGPYLAYGTTGSIVRLGLEADTIEVGGPFDAPVVTDDGTLWLHRTDNSSICSLTKDALLVTCDDSTPGNGTLTTIADKPAWVSADSDTARLVAPATAGAQPVPLGVDLPVGTLIADRDLDGTLAALDPRIAVLYMLDVGGVADDKPGKLASPTVTLPPGKYDAPMATSGTVAVLDHTTNTLQTYDKTGKQIADQPVPADAQGLTRGQDGQLYLDNAAGTKTNVVGTGGTISTVNLGPTTNTATNGPPQLIKSVSPPPVGGTKRPSGNTNPPPGGGPRPPGGGPPPPVGGGSNPPTAPGPVGELAVAAGNGSAVVSWTAPDPAADTYDITWAPAAVPPTVSPVAAGDGTAAAEPAPPVGAIGSTSVSSGSYTSTIPNLVNGVTYTVTVTGVNAKGRGKPTTSAPFRPSGDVPERPTSVTVGHGTKAGSPIDHNDTGVIDLSWTAPVVTGTEPITSYVITAHSAGGTASRVATSTTTSVKIATGLTLGAQYTFTVSAVDASGVSPDSDPSDTITPYTPTGPPTGLTATVGSGRIDLAWTAPRDLGGNAGPVAYSIVTDGLPEATTSATTYSYPIGVPKNGTTYRIAVAAFVSDPVDDGPSAEHLYSARAYTSATPGGPPTLVITNLTLADRNVTVSVEVDAHGGNPIHCSILFNGTERFSGTCPEGSSSHYFNNLPYSTSYTVSAKVSSQQFGTGTASPTWPVQTPDAPAPTPMTTRPPPAGVPDPQTPAPSGHSETAGGDSNTHANFMNAGGASGPQIAGQQTVTVSCRAQGFKTENGNPWWYRIASSPWNNAYYASADAFYNGSPAGGSLKGTAFVDESVPMC